MSESGSNGKTRRPIDKRRMKASSRPTTWFRRIRHERQFKECSRRHYYRSATATTRHNLSSYTPSATSISNPLRTAVSFRLSRLWQIALVRFRLRLEQILSSFCSGGKFMLLVSLLTYLDPLVPYHYSDGWFPIVDFRHRKKMNFAIKEILWTMGTRFCEEGRVSGPAPDLGMGYTSYSLGCHNLRGTQKISDFAPIK